MNQASKYHYYGDGRVPSVPFPKTPDTPEPYIASVELKDAVNLAIHLRRPLLLEGEAGCGKTRLARAVAYKLGLPFYSWHVRSTSKAEDGLYHYDSVLRLHDVQICHLESQNSERKPTAGRDPGVPKDYRTFGPLGEAFQLRECPAVVLIDEIDKADIDFPNDLLEVLDEWKFTIRETGEEIAATPECKPIVIITSNKEKGNLPSPFLRRCIYHYLDFPDEARLKQIVYAHYNGETENPPANNLAEQAITLFFKVRDKKRLQKNPGTSEFLDWLKCLHTFRSSPYDPTVLATAIEIPYKGLLFKLAVDFQNKIPLGESQHPAGT